MEIIFRFALLFFLLIQPFKILTLLTGFNFNYLLVVPFLYFGFVSRKNVSTLRPFAFMFLIQVLLAVFSLRNGIFDKTYLFLFFYSPQFGLLIARTYRPSDYRFTINAFLTYSLILAALAIASVCMYASSVREHLWSAFSYSSILRDDRSARLAILDALNIGRNVFGFDERALEGVALTIYPLVFISFLFLKCTRIYWREAVVLTLCFVFLMLKNSRGEVLFGLGLLSGILLEKISRPNFKWAYLSLMPFPFIQLLFGSRFLNGRGPLNEVFLNHVSAFGYGMGFSKGVLFDLTKGDHSSFHNIHFETIVNFGLLIYIIFVLLLIAALLRFKESRPFVLLSLSAFLLFSTNYELFDVYTAMIFGLVFSEAVRNSVNTFDS